MELILVLIVLAVLVLPLVSFVLALVVRVRVKKLEHRVQDLEADKRMLEQQVRALMRVGGEARAGAPEPLLEPLPEAVVPVSRVAPAVTASVPQPPAVVAAAEPYRPSAAPAEPVAPPPEPVPPLPAAAPPLPAPGLPLPRPESAPPRGLDLESLVGVRLFSWIAGIAVVVAAVAFLRYSIEQGWLQPPVQMAIGLLTGVALLVICELRAADRYRITANALDGAAIAVLFATFFAGHARWGLVPLLPTFLLMALVAGVAVALAVRRDSLFIALLGLMGGFATPALLETGMERPVGLFGYLVILNAGLAWVARQRRWPILSPLAVALTLAYQWVWATRFLTEARLPLATAIFVLFPALGCAAAAWLWSGRRAVDGSEGAPPLVTHTASLGALVPLAFALYMAAVPAYGANHWLLFGFLLLVDAGLLGVALWRGPRALHLAGAASTALVVAIWFGTSYHDAAWPGVLAAVSGFVLFYLFAPTLAARIGRPLTGGSGGVDLAEPVLLFAFPALMVVEPRSAAAGLPFAVLLGLALVAAAVAVARRRTSIQLTAGVAVVAAEVAWTAVHLEPARRAPALWVAAGFGVLLLMVPVVARWLDRPLKAAGLAAAPGLAGLALLVPLALEPELALLPWSLLAVLGLLTVTASVAALVLGRSALLLGATCLAGVVLLSFELANRWPPWPTVATLAAIGVAALALLSVWITGRGRDDGAAALTGRLTAVAVIALLLAQAVAIAGLALPGAPATRVALATNLALVLALLGLAAWQRRHWLAVLAVLPASAAVLAWEILVDDAGWSERLLFALPFYLAFLAYPVVVGRRLGGSFAPHLAAILASGPFFLVARQALLEGGHGRVIGLLPAAQAAALGLLFAHLLRQERRGSPTRGRLALVAGAALAFVTLAVPVQLDRQWVTLGWAAEGLALAWLYRRVGHRGLLAGASGLLGAAFCRLALNPAVLDYYPRSSTPVWNWYLYTYLAAAAAMFLAALLLRGRRDSLAGWLPRVSVTSATLGAVLLFLLLNIEVADAFASGPRITFSFHHASLAQDLSYTLAWAVFAFALLIAGVILRSRGTRVAAIGLLAVTVVKAFLHDLASLGGLYLVGSFIGLAVALALVALAIQRFVLASPDVGASTHPDS